MRQHCKSQHKFDPFPVDFPKPQFGGRTNQNESVQNEGTSNLSAKFDEMIAQCQTIERLASGSGITPPTANPIPSHEEAIDHMLANYVIIDKKELQGISGYICNNCLTFHFHFIKDIGIDMTAQEKHLCVPADVERANQIPNKSYAIVFLHHNSLNCLSTLTNWIFGKELSVTVRQEGQVNIVEPDSSTTQDLLRKHIPLFKVHSFTPQHWAWNTIHRGSQRLNEDELKNILKEIGGTYAAISVDEPPDSGTYVVSISTSTK